MNEDLKSRLQSRTKLQTASSKLQRNIKQQAPGARLPILGSRSVHLLFGIWSFSGAWSLVLGALVLGSANIGVGQNLLLSRATVHTVSGETLSPGQVLIQNGKIAAVGATIPPSSAQTIDLNGQHLYPCIIAMDPLLGQTERGAVRATQDSTEVGDFTPEVESWIEFNPFSELIPVNGKRKLLNSSHMS